MGATAFIVTDEERSALIEARLEKALPSDVLQKLAAEKIHERVGMLTMGEACRLFGCPTTGALLQFCTAHKIKVTQFGQKKRFIRIEEIERVQKLHERVPIDPENKTGTVIAPRAPKKLLPFPAAPTPNQPPGERHG